jgi:hypothetical protein
MKKCVHFVGSEAVLVAVLLNEYLVWKEAAGPA